MKHAFREAPGMSPSLSARSWFAVAAAVVLTACAGTQDFHGTNLLHERLASPSFDTRRPNYVILHHTSNDSAGPAIATLTNRDSAVSAHYLVRRDGSMVQLVDERMRAWHAGESYWAGNTDLNSASIGIELDNSGAEPFAQPQIITLLGLLADLRERYRIPAANVLGHADVAPRRKTDPGPAFPWKLLAMHGFGLWCDVPDGAVPPQVASDLMLKAIGYELVDVPATVLAFRRHFLGSADAVPATGELSESERALAYCLAGKKGYLK